jgi:hypothetical protein
MKKPIIEDFDPEARTRELGSPLDGMPRIEKPRATEVPQRKARELPVSTAKAAPERAFAPTTVRPFGKRIITRNSFEIYEDQMDSLRELSFQEKRQGKLGSMSGMVRDAIDEYLRKHPVET